MKKNCLTLNIYCIVIAIGYIVLLGSCTPVKNVVYFENLQKDTTLHNVVNGNFELKIRKNDLLYINIVSPDPIQNALFNAQQISVTSPGSEGGGNATPTSGFLVDENGNIILYKLGVIHAEGLTRNELKQKLQKALVPDYLKDAVITIRFLSNKITVLGEVAHPQVLTMQNEQMSLMEAFGLTGDIMITGRKDNILVIRESNNGKQFKRLNLTDNSIFNSPFYYLKPDDVIYVEPTKVKIKNSGNNPQMIGYIISAASIVITILANLLFR